MKLTYAYFDYLFGLCDAKDLQEIAQQDINEFNIQSESLFYFVYILDKENDVSDLFERALKKITTEFGWPIDRNTIPQKSIKKYIDYKLDLIIHKDVEDYTIFNEFYKIGTFLSILAKANPWDSYYSFFYKLKELYGQDKDEIINELFDLNQKIDAYCPNDYYEIYSKEMVIALQNLAKKLIS